MRKSKKIGVRQVSWRTLRFSPLIYTFISSPHIGELFDLPNNSTSHVQPNPGANQSPRAIATASRAAHTLTRLTDRKSKPKRPSSALVRALSTILSNQSHSQTQAAEYNKPISIQSHQTNQKKPGPLSNPKQASSQTTSSASPTNSPTSATSSPT